MSRKRINECVICHKLFTTTSATAKYCSRECRLTARNPNWSGGQSRWGHSYDHICKWCGKPYTSGSPHGDYCSTPCREKARKAMTPKGERIKPINEIVKEADALGLSYGQYVAKFGGG